MAVIADPDMPGPGAKVAELRPSGVESSAVGTIAHSNLQERKNTPPAGTLPDAAQNRVLADGIAGGKKEKSVCQLFDACFEVGKPGVSLGNDQDAKILKAKVKLGAARPGVIQVRLGFGPKPAVGHGGAIYLHKEAVELSTMSKAKACVRPQSGHFPLVPQKLDQTVLLFDPLFQSYGWIVLNDQRQSDPDIVEKKLMVEKKRLSLP